MTPLAKNVFLEEEMTTNNPGNNKTGNVADDRQKASDGKKGGQSSGNFANDRQKASEAGKKGGQSSHGSSRS